MTAGFTAFAGEVLYDDFSANQEGGWATRYGTGSVVFSNETVMITPNPNGQPSAAYHAFTPTVLLDGDTLRMTVDISTDDLDARDRDIRIALGNASTPITGYSGILSVPLSGYLITFPISGSGADPRVSWIDSASANMNFFNSSTANIGDPSLDNNVFLDATPKTAVLEITRSGTNLVFTGSLGGTDFGFAVTASVPNIVSNYTFNTAGLGYAYAVGQVGTFDNVKVELNPNPDAVELFSTTFDDALQLEGTDTPINMGGTNNDIVALSDLIPGAGIGSLYHVRTDGAYTNYAGMTASLNTGSNLASAVATDCYLELTCAGGVAYESLTFSMIKFGFAALGGVTVRSSLDNYTANLLTVEDEITTGSYRGALDLAAVPGMDSAGSVTFRFYFYDEYEDGQSNRKIGLDNIRITGVPIAKQFFVTDFESATQPGGLYTSIDMAGSVYSNLTVSALTNASGMNGFAVRSSAFANGQFASETIGSNIASNLASAISNDEYCEFTLSSTEPVDLSLISFELAKHGTVLLGGITLRSSEDGFTSDLVTVTNDTSQGVFPTFVDLSSNPDFDEISSVTFRFYFYDEYIGANNRYFGIDNIDVSGVFWTPSGPPNEAVLTVTAGSETVTISASNLSADAQNQLQSKTALTDSVWGDVGAAVSGVTTTNWVISVSEPASFYQVESFN
jgi:hypothetical protein